MYTHVLYVPVSKYIHTNIHTDTHVSRVKNLTANIPQCFRTCQAIILLGLADVVVIARVGLGSEGIQLEYLTRCFETLRVQSTQI